MKRQARAVDKVRREVQSTKTPPFSEWEPWRGVEHLAPGRYHAPEEDLEAIRAQFLETGCSPRVLLNNETSIKSLQYTCSKRDGVCGVVVVHGFRRTRRPREGYNGGRVARTGERPPPTSKRKPQNLRFRRHVSMTPRRLESRSWLGDPAGAPGVQLGTVHRGAHLRISWRLA